MRVLGSGFAVLAVWLALVGSASAAFPGRNGLLAVQPLHGNGIVLVSRDGAGQHRICTNVRVCGQPVRPRFSPDGHSIVFAAPAVRIIETNGACQYCRFGMARNPAFLPGGTLVSLVSHAPVGTIVDIDSVVGPQRAALPYANSLGYSYPSDAVWAASGALAEVAGGRVLAGPAGDLRAIGPGTDPSWSPDGSRIALVRRGWITVVRVADGRARRVVRGTAPGFSPDGRWIAFVDQHHRIEVVRASGGRPRPVGRVEGLAVDWQPLVSHPPTCVPPPGSQVIARSARAVITSNPSQGSYGDEEAVIGCLLPSGRQRLLEVTPAAEPPSGVVAGTSGNYAALAINSTDRYGNLFDSTRVFDLRTGRPAGFGGETFACQLPEQLCGTIDQVVVGPSGVSAVHVDGYPDSFAVTVSCAAAASLCLAHGLGDLSSTDPGRGPWTSMPFADATRLSCPSTSLCVATSGSTIYTSTNPTANSPTWTATKLPEAFLTQPSCPSTGLCVVTTSLNYVWWSTNPTGGAQAWSTEEIDSQFALDGIACPTATECVAIDAGGRAITSTDPTGGESDWQSHQVFNAPGDQGISCPSATLCVATQPHPDFGNKTGTLAVTTDPTAGQWTTSTAPDQPDTVDCPSVLLCVAIAVGREVLVSTDPASGSWSRYAIPGLDEAYAVSCSSPGQCFVGGDTSGFLFASSNPAGGPGTWTRVLAEPVSCGQTGVRCGTEQIIASDRTGVHTVDSSTEFEAQTGPQLTGLSLSGDTLSWNDHGSPKTAQLTQ